MYGSEHGGWMFGGGGWMIFGWLWMVLIWLIPILLLFALVKYLLGRKNAGSSTDSPRKNPEK
jgi:putative membrane protein